MSKSVNIPQYSVKWMRKEKNHSSNIPVCAQMNFHFKFCKIYSTLWYYLPIFLNVVTMHIGPVWMFTSVSSEYLSNYIKNKYDKSNCVIQIYLISVVVSEELYSKFDIELITVFTTDILFLLYICIYNCWTFSLDLWVNSNKKQIQNLHNKRIFYRKSWGFFQIESWQLKHSRLGRFANYFIS